MIRDVMRYVERRLAGIRLAYRARLSTLGKGAAMQLVQAEALSGETLQAAELAQHFGFTSGPPAGTQLIVLPLGGSTAHSVIIATENGAYRVDVQSGEACIYSQWGDKVHLKREEIEVATRRLVVTAPDGMTLAGDVMLAGSLTATGDVVAGGVSLQHHTHPGCQGGSTGEAR
ncbi:MAG: phage baseplate assembly protein [Proteobacteria bacterium]|nr:phage baseplate assembly protein [Pseudomonadota bacterium]